MVSKSSTAAQLLEKKGALSRRTNFLPLDKMDSRPISNQDLRKAQQIVGKDNVHRAIDLVDFDPELTKAIEFVFGSVFVCANLDAANALAFNSDRSVSKLCVTLQGDKVNPGGELSGGEIVLVF